MYEITIMSLNFDANISSLAYRILFLKELFYINELNMLCIGSDTYSISPLDVVLHYFIPYYAESDLDSNIIEESMKFIINKKDYNYVTVVSILSKEHYHRFALNRLRQYINTSTTWN